MVHLESTATLRSLTQHVRCMSLCQVHRAEFAETTNGLKAAERRLYRLENRGFVKLQRLAAQELEAHFPLLDHYPGDMLPDFESLAYRAQSRWQKPAVMTLIATATEEAKRITGGSVGGRVIRLRELNHDLLLANVFLRLRRTMPDLESLWTSEDAVYACGGHLSGQLVPDAIITGPEETVTVECAGAYSAKKLRAFHQEFGKGRYQLW